MKTLLVLSDNPGLAGAVRAGLPPEQYRVIAQSDFRQIIALAQTGAIDGCVMEATLNAFAPVRQVEEVRRAMPAALIVLYCNGEATREWEEEAYLAGASYVLDKPVRGRLLESLLHRYWAMASKMGGHGGGSSERFSVPTLEGVPSSVAADASSRPIRMLEVMREVSSILTVSLRPEALLEKFLMMLRSVIGVNRAAIFLRPQWSAGNPESDGARKHLRSAVVLGLDQELLRHFDLSLDGGIGGYLQKTGRILQQNSKEAFMSKEILMEFELLGVQVAIPILDRESLIGVAVFDGRLTGGPFCNEELALVFHLLEELGLSLRNSWLHDQLQINHDRMTDILNELGSGCVAVDANLNILHANRLARKCFLPQGKTGPVEFSHLPNELGSKVYECIRSGKGMGPFRWQSRFTEDRLYRISLTPLVTRGGTEPQAVLLVIEDYTAQDRAHKLELEAVHLKHIRRMAEQLSHEVGNALVPISTLHQMLKEEEGLSEPLVDLANEADDSIKRISRLRKQMLFLAQEQFSCADPMGIALLIEESFHDALSYYSGPSRFFYHQGESDAVQVLCHRPSLKHAFCEIFLNGLQESPVESHITVRTSVDSSPDLKQRLVLDFVDEGTGFSQETRGKAVEPFFSTKTVGLGLGLTVARRIIEAHGGELLLAPDSQKKSSVRVLLPLKGGAVPAGQSLATPV